MDELTRQTARGSYTRGSNKMAESVSFARPPVALEISTGNLAHSWGK